MGFTARNTLNRLSAAWNELYNAAWGRGVGKPLVSAELAEQVAANYEHFRDWADAKSTGLFSTFVNQYWYTDEAAVWENLRRSLASQVTAETGVPLTDVVMPAPQKVVGEVAEVAGRAAIAALPFGRMLTGLLLAGAIFIAVKRLTPNRSRRAA